MKVGSYIQTRGSIPALWSQKPTMKWAPSVKIHPNNDESLILAMKHVEEMKQNYGEQVFINLIDKKGSQLRIGTTFTNIVTNMKDDLIKYVWFDFHHECRNMKWENLSKLIEQVKDKLHGFDHFMITLSHGLDQKHRITDKTSTIHTK
jgi:hypothetical protein